VFLLNKGLLGKISFFSLIFLASILVLIFVLPVLGIPFTSIVAPNNTAASSTNQILNFTIININETGNITQVNITLPAVFGFVAGSNATTANNTNFSSAGQIVFWTNTTEAGFVSSGGTQYFSINVTVPNVSSATYNFNVSTLDASGAYNSTNVTVTVNDTTFPTWSTNQSSTPANYSTTNLSQFNITWSDNVNIDKVIITIRNLTGVLISNASMSDATYGGGIYNYSIILPAGTFNWTSYANDTSGNWNSSTTWTITISNASNPVNLYLNDTLNGNSTYIYPQVINATATSASGTVYIYRNETHIVNGTSPQSEQISLGSGLYIYKINATGNANYSDNTTAITYNATVNKASPTLSLTLNSVEADKSVTYPTATTATGSFSAGDIGANISLYRNGSLVTSSVALVSITFTDTPAAAVYNYTFVYNGTQNYTSGSVTRMLTVSPASSQTPGGSSISGITTTGMITYVTLAVGKANITANYLTTSGKLIANIARYQDVAIRGMNITVVNNVANIKIMISKLPSLPSNVPYDINGKVYNYISTDEQNFTDADIKSVNISFAVNKTWLTNNNVDASNITLYRWANNKWNDLSAVKVSDDGKEVFFTVSSPGLSVFIIGTKGGAPVVTETPACTESWQCTDWSTCTNSKQARTCTDSNSCGTTTSKPSESQSCTVSKGETTVEAPVPTSILTTVIVIVVAIIACVFIFLQRAKISSYLVIIAKKSNNHKKTSYLESLAKKINKVEEEEEEKLNVRTD
jgi:PGF-pre-PGF domain-containing protein